jgi:protein TonB
MRKHLDEPPPIDGALAPLIPTQLAPILERALSKDPDRRHADVKELIRDLEQARVGFRTDTVDGLAAQRLPRWSVPALVLLIAGLALFAWSRQTSLTERGPQLSPAATTAPLPTTTTTLPAAVDEIPPAPSKTPAATRPGAIKPTLVPPVTTPVTTLPTPPPPTVPTTTPATIPVTTTSTIPPTPTTSVPPSPVERPPVCLSCPRPSYPPAAARYGLEGDVEVEIVVDEKGRVTQARALSGHSALRDAARKAVLAWRFAPATRDGVPVACTRRVPVQFRLADKTPP